jgi:uncharacterized protein YndB with AHSA1/START domain
MEEKPQKQIVVGNHGRCSTRTTVRVAVGSSRGDEGVPMVEIWHEVWIDAEASTVFAALTTKSGIDGWWGPVTGVQPKVGAVLEFDHGLGAPLRMEIIEFEAERRVVWRCLAKFDDPTNPPSEWNGQVLAFDVTGRRPVPLLGGMQKVTVLTFRNSGWSEASRWRGFCNTAWGETLGVKLKSFCETGAPFQ